MACNEWGEREKERERECSHGFVYIRYIFLFADSLARLPLRKLCTWKVTVSSRQSAHSCRCLARADCNTLTVCFCVRSSYKLRWCFKPRSVCVCVFFSPIFCWLHFVCLFIFFFVRFLPSTLCLLIVGEASNRKEFESEKKSVAAVLKSENKSRKNATHRGMCVCVDNMHPEEITIHRKNV